MIFKVIIIKINKLNFCWINLSSKIFKYLVCMLGVVCVSKLNYSDDMLWINYI